MSEVDPSVADGEGRSRLPAGRRADLAFHVAEVGQVTVAGLASRFGVSLDTIRRDLDQLDADGVLIRTHGGAMGLSAMPRADTGLDVRVRLQAEAKERIAALAATLVADGSALMMNAGTTVLAVARHLVNHRELTIATNNLRLSGEISAAVCRDIFVFGGSVRHSAQATLGPVGFAAAPGGAALDIRCDLAVIAVGSVDARDGYFTSYPAEAVMMAEMMSRAARVAVLADSSKFGRRQFAQVAELGRADVFVTDGPPPPELAAALDAAGVEVLHPGLG